MKKIASIFIALGIVFAFAITAFAETVATGTVAAADTEKPGSVEELKATPLNNAVKLEWSGVSDNVAVAGYDVHFGLTAVDAKGEFYSLDGETPNFVDVKIPGEKNENGFYEYILLHPDLKNGTTYYFSVVAYDAAGNESKDWAPEAVATPSADAGDLEDTVAPKVSNAEAINQIEVKVVFSEAIVLPAENPEDEFEIESDETFYPLTVVGVVMDETDTTAGTVIVTTAVQEELVNYKLTVGVGVKDRAGNPISSGTSDTALFIGSGAPKEEADVEAPYVASAEPVDSTHFILHFNETVVLGIDPAENFVVVSQDEMEESLTVLGVKLSPNADGVEDASAIITTSRQGNKMYEVTVEGVTDEAGNQIDPEKAVASFQLETLPVDDVGDVVEDLIPPQDVANFLVEKILQAEKYLVTLKWKIPAENAGDTVKQILYMSQNRGTAYSKEGDLQPVVEQYDAGEFAPGEYWFKLTQVDAAGNESEGALAKVILTKTGPGVVGLILVSLGLGRVFGKKRR